MKNNPYQIKPKTKQEFIEGHADWIEDWVLEEGWTPYIISLMFKHIGGGETHMANVMRDETDRAYRICARHITRRTDQERDRQYLPKWFILPDYPIYKLEKQSTKDIRINDGRHMQGICLVPPFNRLKKGLDWHFNDEQHRYVWPDRPLKLIHAKNDNRTLRKMVDYVLKSLKTERSTGDEIILLP